MVKIITHPAAAHRDDFLACCILLAHLDEACVIKRREPTKEELLDPRVWVLDIGGLHEPERLNFDHHQFDRDHAPECALTLLCRHLGLHEAFSNIYSWYIPTAIADSKGPKALAEYLTIQDGQQLWAAQSPIESAALRMFGEHKGDIQCFHPISCFMEIIGKRLLDYVTRYTVRLVELNRQCSTYQAGPCRVAQHSIKEDPALALNAWAEPLGIDVTVTPDDRRDGWTLFRLNDELVDFSLIEGQPGVHFAHKNGFVAKVDKDVNIASLIEKSTVKELAND